MNLPLETHLSVEPIPHPRLTGDYVCCPQTGAIYYRKARQLDYNDRYFLVEYERQYGRTYIEDEPNLREMSRRRLNRLRKYKQTGRLLELGCATGFFLDEARTAGFKVEGIEVSNFAARYAREKLGLQVESRSILQREGDSLFDVIAAFYVIEHLPEQKSLFASIARLLKPGGYFLFALPGTHGPTFHCDPEKWMNTHPADHFVDYSPQSLRNVAGLYGMRLKAAWPASYHPDRACGWMGLRVLRPLYPWLARRRCYGDTFEGILMKSR